MKSRPSVFLAAGFFLAMALLSTPALGAKSPKPAVVLVGVDANKLDPQFYTSSIELSFLLNMFDSLVFRNWKMEIEPALATSWSISEDGLAWTFKLRKGVKFHNGEPFDARAVKFTFDRMLDPEVKVTLTVPRHISLDRTEILDDYTVRIHTKEPVPNMLPWLVNAYILAPGYYSRLSPREVTRQPVGTGPYRLVEWVKDDHIRMEAFEDYWRGVPDVKTIIWRPVPEASARVAELETGGADIIVNVSPEQADIIRRAKGARLAAIQGGRRIHLGIRCDRWPFGDKRVRQALNYAVNFEAISKFLLGGVGKKMATIVNPPFNDPRLRAYPYDPDKARELLREAGLRDSDGDGFIDRDGKPFKVLLDTPVGRYLKDEEMAQAVAADFKRIGLYVEVVPLEWAVYTVKRYRERNPDPLFLLGFGSGFDGEADVGILHNKLFANLTGWYNEEFEQKYAKLLVTFNKIERVRLIHELQDIIHDEAPWVFLWMQYDLYGVSERIAWQPRPDQRIYLYGVKYTGGDGG